MFIIINVLKAHNIREVPGYGRFNFGDRGEFALEIEDYDGANMSLNHRSLFRKLELPADKLQRQVSLEVELGQKAMVLPSHMNLHQIEARILDIPEPYDGNVIDTVLDLCHRINSQTISQGVLNRLSKVIEEQGKSEAEMDVHDCSAQIVGETLSFIRGQKIYGMESQAVKYPRADTFDTPALAGVRDEIEGLTKSKIRRRAEAEGLTLELKGNNHAAHVEAYLEANRNKAGM